MPTKSFRIALDQNLLDELMAVTGQTEDDLDVLLDMLLRSYVAEQRALNEEQDVRRYLGCRFKGDWHPRFGRFK